MQAPFEAAQEQGAAVSKAAMDMQDLYNKTTVNDVFANQFSPAVQSAAADFYSKTGKAAADALPAYQLTLQNLKAQASSGMVGQQAMMFNEMATGRLENEAYRASMHAGDEMKQYAAQTSQAVVGNFYNQVQNGSMNQDRLTKSLQQLSEVALGRLPAAQQQQVLTAKMQNVGQLDAEGATPSSSSFGVSPNSIGNVKTPEAAVSGALQYQQPTTPTDGVILAANTLRGPLYQGKNLQQIAATWTGEPNKAAAWASTVSQVSGIAPDAVPNLNDPVQLQSIMKGMNVAENPAAKQAAFTSDIINNGVQASLSGAHPSLGAPTSVPATTPTPQQALPSWAGDLPNDKLSELLQKSIAQKNMEDRNVSTAQQYDDAETGLFQKTASGSLSVADVTQAQPVIGTERAMYWLKQIADGTTTVDANDPKVIAQRGVMENMKVDDPTGFEQYDFSKLSGQLPSADIAKLQGDAVKMRQGDQGLAAQNKRAADIKASVADMLPVSWKASTKETPQDQQASEAFQGNLIAAVQSADANGKPLSRDDIRKMASDSLMTKVSVPGKLWGTNDIPATSIPVGTNPSDVHVAGTNNVYIPQTFSVPFSSAYQKIHGVAPSSDVTLGAYKSSKGFK